QNIRDLDDGLALAGTGVQQGDAVVGLLHEPHEVFNGFRWTGVVTHLLLRCQSNGIPPHGSSRSGGSPALGVSTARKTGCGPEARPAAKPARCCALQWPG